MAEATLVEIEMPAMGESVTEGTVLEWHVKEGDSVEEGQTVVEVSTDKVDAEVPAPADGTITKLLVGEDDTVQVGQALAQLDPNGARPDRRGLFGGRGQRGGGAQARSRLRPPDAERRVQVVMPEMGESVTEGTVLEWHVNEGDSVEEGQTVIEVSTDKVDAEVPAPTNGTVTKLLVEPDDIVKVGQALAEMSAGAAPSTADDGERPATRGYGGYRGTFGGGRRGQRRGARHARGPPRGG